MGNIISITENNGTQVVSARNLHQFLEVKTDFTNWCKRMFEYGFEEDKDFTPILEKNPIGRPSADYALTLDTSKEISMLQRTEKGKEARKYFIEFEKRHRKPVNTLDYMQLALDQLREQESRISKTEKAVLELKAQTQTRSDYFTIVGYATLNGISCGLKIASSLGKKATSLCNQRNIPTESLPDPRFGIVKTYPIPILEEVFSINL
jgi:anti-repressor protein